MTSPPDTARPHRARLGGWIAVGVLVVALATLLGWFVLSGLALTEASPGDPPPRMSPVTPSGTGVPSPTPTLDAPPTPAPGGLPAGITALVDPAWVQRTAQSTGIPSRTLAAYAGADLRVRNDTGCAVGWNTLAGIGLVESDHGAIHGSSIGEDGVARPHIVGIPLDGTRSAAIGDTDGGAVDGDTQWDRAVGPMQFIPDTWARWGSDGDGDGRSDIHHIDDAALAAARYLCHARSSLEDGDAWVAAIRSYNDDDAYLQRVSDAATSYAALAPG